MLEIKHNSLLMILGCLLLFAVVPNALAQPNAPVSVVAFPAYGPVNEIVIRWQDDAGDEDGFHIERGVGAIWTPVFTHASSPGTEEVEWRDGAVSLDTLYSYRVRAFNASGNSAWVLSEETQRPTHNPWPRDDGVRDIMHIWSASSTNTMLYHEGIDFYAIPPVPDPPPVVRAIRGGTLATTTFGGPGIEVAVEVEVSPGVYEYDYYLHLQDITAKAVGDQIAPEEFLGRITLAFYGPDRHHTHIMRMSANSLDFAVYDTCHSPWLLFSTADDLDPFGNLPHLLDQSGSGVGYAPDGRVVFAVEATNPDTVVDPVRGDVDILVEAYDAKNASLDYENNLSALGYWVESLAPGGTDIASPAAPLRLFDFDDTWFIDSVPIRDTYDDVFDTSRPHPGYTTKRGHYICTSATSASADPDPDDADGSRFWRSKARTTSGTPPYFDDATEARHNGEARFPDGTYTVHALLSDEVNHDIEATSDLVVDNWLPYVVSVVSQSTVTLSHAQWLFDSGAGMMNAQYPGGPTDIIEAGAPETDITFTITFSEPMATATLTIPGVSWASTTVLLTANADATQWTGTLAGGSPPPATDPSGLYFLHINGTDMAGNNLAGRSNFASFNPVTELDPDSGATGTDDVHRFAIATQRDIVLLLDRSGSMGGSTPGFTTKMAALIDAGNIFLDILTPSSAIDIGAVKYDDVIELLCPSCAMAPADSIHIGDIREGIDDLTQRNLTSIGGGLIEAANQLSAAGDEKNLVLLFTDGKHNTSPTVTDGLNAIHDLVPDNTTISAIGFGTGTQIDIPQLQTIVDSTNGELWTTTSGLELHKFFIEALMNAGGTPYSIFITDPVVSINKGEVKEHLFTTSSADRQIAVIVEWGNTAGKMNASLISPNGSSITATDAASNPHITYTGGNSYAMYQLSFPLGTSGHPLAQQWQGTWRIVVDASATSSGQHQYAYSVVSSSDLSVDASIIGGKFAGDKMYILAKLRYKGKPVAGRLTASIDYPLVSSNNIMASVDIPTATLANHKKYLKKKHIVDKTLTAHDIYQFSVEQKLASTLNFPRAQITKAFSNKSPSKDIVLGPGEFIVEIPETKVAGDYRISLAVNSVGFEQHSARLVFLAHPITAQFDFDATKIAAQAVRELYFLNRDKTYPILVEVSPQDKFGNLVGPGLIEAKAFKATQVKGATLSSISDKGNGIYELVLQPDRMGRNVKVQLDIQGKPAGFTVTPEGRIKKHSGCWLLNWLRRMIG